MVIGAEGMDAEAVENFKEYVRIRSVHPNVDYGECILFLKRQAARIGLPLVVHEMAPGKPVAVMSWAGLNSELPSLLLSSHMDVVPVSPQHWTTDPFGADQDQQGNIYGRGTQDMKCVGVQYLEAVHRLKQGGTQPARTVHLCFTPDEEIGSAQGMDAFSLTDAFRRLNVGCALDEGIASPDDSFNLYYGERRGHRTTISCSGAAGHGSLLPDNTAGEKVMRVLRSMYERRDREVKRLRDDPTLTMGDVTSINLTTIHGGIKQNVIPSEIVLEFDCRLEPSVDRQEFDSWLRRVCREAGEGVRLSEEHDAYHARMRGPVTVLDDANPWWVKIRAEFDRMRLTVKPLIFPAGTDSRFLRALGIPAFGFSPMNNTPVKLHDHDEFLNVKVFLKGIEIYEKLIAALASA